MLTPGVNIQWEAQPRDWKKIHDQSLYINHLWLKPLHWRRELSTCRDIFKEWFAGNLTGRVAIYQHEKSVTTFPWLLADNKPILTDPIRNKSFAKKSGDEATEIDSLIRKLSWSYITVANKEILVATQNKIPWLFTDLKGGI